MADKTIPDILYTTVDEAPELASASLLPIIQFFARAAHLQIEKRDISLAGRIIAAFPDNLTAEQRQADHLAELGELVKTPMANVIKLPNISASVPQLTAAIAELQAQGYNLPNYSENPQTHIEKTVRARYDAIKGSAVNPVLRQGNSDRRAAKAVKKYAMQNPHSMGTWGAGSNTHVASMSGADFFSNETSATLTEAQAGVARIEFTDNYGVRTVLKDGINLQAGTVVDATFMSTKALRTFLTKTLAEAKAQGVLFSLHLKATMMKVSDPIIFGHAVSVFLEPFMTKHEQTLAEIGFHPNSGLNDLEQRLSDLPEAKKSKIEADLGAAITAQPPLYMVNSSKGISNLHVPSDVIIDASMPALIRAGGKGWGPDGKTADCICVIPDTSYSSIYEETIEYFKQTGALDPTISGAVSNVGLMAQKAEEYGSHPTTFEAMADGTIQYILHNGEVLHEHQVEKGDIWRSSSTNRGPIEDWVKLGLARQQASGATAVFWLDENRSHDAEIIKYVNASLAAAGVTENKLKIMSPRAATRFTLETIRKGEDCISITGNVLRDYLTDLFPILELGTSAKMLSIVKLMQGGGLFETGAGGSAPKHVQQLVEEGHLRWDSLGEFCALGESLKFVAESQGKPKAAVLGNAVEEATQRLLENNNLPNKRVGQTDNRDSHFYFALYWSKALSEQTEDAALAAHFAPVAQELTENKSKILAELAALQGEAADLGGYYHTDAAKTAAVMRPSATFNAIIG